MTFGGDEETTDEKNLLWARVLIKKNGRKVQGVIYRWWYDTSLTLIDSCWELFPFGSSSSTLQGEVEIKESFGSTIISLHWDCRVVSCR